MEYADSHLHLQDERLVNLTGRVIAGAISSHVTTIILQATSLDDFQQVADFRLPDNCPVSLYKFFGIHPWFSEKLPPDWQSILWSYLKDYGCGIGEIGIDYIKECEKPEIRQNVFRSQMSMAAELNLPVSVHCIKAWRDLLEIITTSPCPPAIHIHGYGGPIEIARKLIDMGCWISFAPSVCFEKHKKARAAAVIIPTGKLLSESDCPDMPGPADIFTNQLTDPSGKPISQPSEIPLTIAKLAELRGQSPDKLAEAIYRNTQDYLSFAKAPKL